jgi:hypothetical protein
MLARDYINHEKLSAIFAAREDMKAAVSKLEGVFSSGKILSSQVRHTAHQNWNSMQAKVLLWMELACS